MTEAQASPTAKASVPVWVQRALVLSPMPVAAMIAVLAQSNLWLSLTIIVVAITAAYLFAGAFPEETARLGKPLSSGNTGLSRCGFFIATIFGPPLLMLLSAAAGSALERFKSTLNPNVANPDLKSANSVAQSLRRAFPSLLTPKCLNIALWTSAVVWGASLYGLITYKAFSELYSTLAEEAELKLDPGTDGSSASAIAKGLLYSIKHTETPDTSLLNKLSYAIDQTWGVETQSSHAKKLPAIRLAAEFLVPGQCQGERCRTEEAMAQLLIGIPAWSDDKLVCWLTTATGTNIKNDCFGASPPSWLDFPGLIGFTSVPGRSPQQVAKMMLTPQKCNDDDFECQTAITLMQMGMDDQTVRSKLTYEVGFIYGWGRLIVAILFFGVLNALLYRRCARTLLASQYTWVMLETQSDVLAPPTTIDSQLKEAERLVKKFDADRQFQNLLKANRTEPQSATHGADPRLHPIAAALYSGFLGLKTQNGDALQSSEELALGGLDRWRENFTSIITLFPVIGFSATLLGLIAALGGADRIAVDNEASRANAIREMVGLLSSCFATTFLALLCMAIFAIISQRQAYAEREIVSSVYSRLMHVFRPRGS